MRNKFFWIIIGLLMAIMSGVILTTVSSSKKVKEITPSITPSPQAKNKETEVSVREITVQANEYSFFPSLISVKVREKVQLTFRNMGALSHNLTIEGLNLATKTVGTGQSDVLEFTPDKPGTYLFYCSVGTHRELGMEGTLEVK